MFRKILPMRRISIVKFIVVLIIGSSGECFSMDMDLSAKSEDKDSGTIIVTARKRGESLQDIPISMSVLNQQAIDRNIVPSDSNGSLARFSPNISFSDNGGQFSNLFVIRGVGAFAPLSPDDTSVGVYLDEVPRSVYGAPITLFDINRVEIMRGPQGTLFGRNTEGGAINVIPNPPTFQNEVKLTSEVGTHGHWVGEGIANGKLTDSLAGRMAIRYSNTNGTIPNLSTGGKDGSVHVGAIRGSLLWIPDDRNKISLTGFYDHKTSDSPRFILYQNPNFPQSAVNPRGNISWRDIGGLFKLEHFFDTMYLTSLTSYQDDNSFQPLDMTDALIYSAMTTRPRNYYDIPYADYAALNFKERTLQQEIRLSSLDDELFSWTGGVNFYHSSFIGNSWSVASPAAFNFQKQNGIQNNRIDTNTLAGFGEGTLALTEKLKTTLGLRYTYENKKGDYRFTGNGNPFVVDLSHHNMSLSDSFITGRTGVTYQFTEDIMGYITFSRGAVSAGYPATQNNGPSGKAEVAYPTSTNWTYEAGLKTAWLDQRFELTGSVFYNDVKNGHLIIFDPSKKLFGSASLDYQSKGGELEALIKIDSYFKFKAGVGYTQSEIVNVPIGSPTGAKSGNMVPDMAKLNGVLGLQYDKAVNINGINGNLKADLVWQLQGKRAADVKNSFDLPGYTVLNTRLGWQHANWEVYGFAWNILNKQYLVGGQQWGNGVSSVRVGQPRILGMGISVDF